MSNPRKEKRASPRLSFLEYKSSPCVVFCRLLTLSQRTEIGCRAVGDERPKGGQESSSIAQLFQNIHLPVALGWVVLGFCCATVCQPSQPNDMGCSKSLGLAREETSKFHRAAGSTTLHSRIHNTYRQRYKQTGAYTVCAQVYQQTRKHAEICFAVLHEDRDRDRQTDTHTCRCMGTQLHQRKHTNMKTIQ